MSTPNTANLSFAVAGRPPPDCPQIGDEILLDGRVIGINWTVEHRHADMAGTIVVAVERLAYHAPPPADDIEAEA